MKRSLFLIIAVLFCVLLLIATATACKDDGDTGENPGGDVTENPEPEVYYTVTFDTQGGSAMASVEVKEGAVIGNVTLPTKQCAEFVGFAEDANGKEMWDLNSDTVTGNITLYAIWEDAHTWEAWETVSEPTCAAEGARKRICDKCGDDETERIPALGHDFEEEYTVDVAPDCVTKGSESRHCTRCDATTDSREIEALGHDFEEEYTVDVAPGCLTKGSESRHCTRCDATTDSREIEALGHNYMVWAHDDTNHWQTCSRCGAVSEKTAHVYDADGKCECGVTEITPESEFTFTDLGNNTWSVDGYSGSDSAIVIPSRYNGGKVISIGYKAFEDCTGLTSVTIGAGVTSIGYGAFEDCTGLTSVTIGAGVTSIWYEAFRNCTGLTEINWNAVSVEDFDYNSNVFYNAGTAGEGIAVMFGESVQKIPSYAFYGCSGLTSVTIPDSVMSIGSSVFYRCTGLTSITIGEGVTYIGERAFYNCSGLTSVTIPDSMISIGDYAFYNCSGLTSVTIPNSVTSIGAGAFYNCTGLTEINWNAVSVEDLGSNVFYNAGTASDGITVTFGENVEKIPAYLFYVNSSSDRPNIKSVTIGSNVTSIGDYAFSGCTGLTSVTIGDSVTSIGSHAFSGCSGLKSITIPFVGAEAGKTSGDTYQYPFGYIFGTTSYTGGTEVKQYYYGSSPSSTTNSTYYIPSSLREVTVTGGNILRGAFYNCSGLTSVTIGDGVISIGVEAFRYCTRLTSVTIGDSVTSIGRYAFYDCSGSMSIYYTGDIAGWCRISRLGAVMSSGRTLYIDGSKVEGAITIPDSVTSIGGYAFYNCSGLTSVTIGDGVKSIGESAFA